MKYIQLLRVTNWLKNIFVLFPLVFSLKLFDQNSIINSIIAFLAFCFISSTIYILNDIVDVEQDKLHPRKKNRPLAAGIIKKSTAITLIFILLLFTALSLYFLPLYSIYTIATYALLNLLYVIILRNVFLIDSIIISLNFVLRVLEGCFAIEVLPSKWILVVTFFTALFLAFIKRKSELIILSENAENHRKTLKEYSISLLDKYIYICTTIAITGYMFYSIDPNVIKIFQTDKLIYSLIFVVLGFFRFIQLSESSKYGKEGDPTTIIIKDTYIKIIILSWLIYIIGIIYFI